MWNHLAQVLRTCLIAVSASRTPSLLGKAVQMINMAEKKSRRADTLTPSVASRPMPQPRPKRTDKVIADQLLFCLDSIVHVFSFFLIVLTAESSQNDSVDSPIEQVDDHKWYNQTNVEGNTICTAPENNRNINDLKSLLLNLLTRLDAYRS